MSGASDQTTIAKKADTDEKKETSEEEGEEDESDYEDDHGSKVVAALCRKVNPPKPTQKGTDGDLVIAVVVTSRGNRQYARKCADAYIKKLKGAEGVLTCDIIAGDNNKRKSKDATNQEEEEEGNEDDEEEAKGADDDDNSSKEKEAQLVEYTPKEFHNQVYGKTPKPGYPLGGGLISHNANDAINMLHQNYTKLVEAKEKKADFKSTWLVLHKTHDQETPAIVRYYDNLKNKVVVVVLSTQFFYPNKPSGRVTIEKPILVCNVPYCNGKGTLSEHYKGIFHQIDAFLTLHNRKKNDSLDKIGTIAISYPRSLIGKRQPIKKQAPKQSKSNSKKIIKKSAKPKVGNGKKKEAKSQPAKAGPGSSSEDEDEDEDEEQEQEDEASGEESDPESSDTSESESDEWLRALKGWAGDDDENEATKHDIEIKLMYEEGSDIWGAPANVKRYFEENNNGLLQKFPNCIETTEGKKKQNNTVNLDELKTTMFVCDLEPKKRVGNNNDGATTGGVFGQWVPMHYTAAYIDEGRYIEDSVEKIKSLVGVVFTNTEDTTAASETTEQIDLAKLETSVDERRKLVDVMGKIYDQGYEPPKWVGDNYANKEFDSRAPKAMVFYDQGQEKKSVKKVAMQREPVNIATTTYFDKHKMSAAFGYSESYYLTSFTESNAKQLAPNIGVYTFSLVHNAKNNEYIKKKMYHAIGAALDHADQPDFKFYVKNGNADVAGLVQFYVSVFAKIFTAAKKCTAPGIVMSLVGAESFAKLYPEGKGKMQEEVWIPAFEFVRTQDNNSAVKLALMSDPEKSAQDPAYKYMINKVKARNSGKFPDFMFDDNTNESYRNWMIVNAWDCHTIPGNGNNKDQTIDGIIGRMSEIHYFGWGTSNPHLLKDGNMIEVAIPVYKAA